MHIAASALAEISALLGAGAVLDPDHDDLTRFEDDARGGRGRAGAVVRPADVAGVRATVRWAISNGLRLVPQGANTGLVGASIPDPSASMVVLSLERMTTMLAIDPVDSTARVSAGVRLSQLNAAAAQHGLFFPIDLPADPSIGGMIATNTGGARLLRYGDVRHNLLALTAVIADDDATVVRAGRGLRKDNTGLDIKQLFVGTGGAFGVITEAVVRLHRRPASRAAAMLALADADAAVAVMEALEQRDSETVSAFESISANAMRHTLQHSGARAPFATIAPQTALVELASVRSDRDLDQELAAVLGSLNHPGMLDAAFGPPDNWWAIRHRVTQSLRTAGAVVAFDVSVRRGDLPELLRRTARLLGEHCPGAELCDFGHLGDGGTHLNLLFPHGIAAPSGVALDDLRMAVFDLVEALGGSYSAEHGLGPRNALISQRDQDPTTATVVDSLLERFDPHGVFGGRFVV